MDLEQRVFEQQALTLGRDNPGKEERIAVCCRVLLVVQHLMVIRPRRIPRYQIPSSHIQNQSPNRRQSIRIQ